jgi:transposase
MSDVTVSPSPEPNWAAFVAIDWADQEHCWKLCAAGSNNYEVGTLLNTPEALADWSSKLRDRFAGQPIAVGLEQSRGPLVYALAKFPHLILFSILPTTSASYRKAFSPSGSKSDPGDTTLLLEILLHHRDRLRRIEPDTVETRLLQMLTEERRQLVDERTRYSNKLTAWLKMFFPQALDLVSDTHSPLACDLLMRWPALEKLQRTNPAKLQKFFTEHNCRSEKRIQERIDAIYKATSAVEDAALLEVGPATVTELVRVIQALNSGIKAFDLRIEAAVSNHPDAHLFAHLPGAGPALHPRLVAAFGTRRDRFTSAADVQAYAGIAPVTEASGQNKWVHIRRACPKFLRQTFHEFAAHSIVKCTWAKAYYEHQCETGHNHHAAVRALAFKWIRVLYACWRDRIPYDDATYTRALERRHSPLAKMLGSDVRLQTVAGFKTLVHQDSKKV